MGVITFQLQLFFRVSKLGKVCRTDSPQAYHNRSQLSVHEWGFHAGIPKWGCPLCKASLPRIFVSECGFTPFTLFARYSWERVVLLWHARKIPHLLTLGNQSLKYGKWAQTTNDFRVCLTGFFGEAAQHGLYLTSPLCTLNFFYYRTVVFLWFFCFIKKLFVLDFFV